jgi:uncharacterized protein (TIGR02001 family)
MQLMLDRRRPLAGAAFMLTAGALFSAPANAQLSVTGNVGVVSDYVLWGITTPGTESDGLAVQGGFDFEFDSGFYAGWWASSLGYGEDPDSGTNLATAVENGLFFGYSGGDSVTYDIGVWRYQYMDLKNANAWEPYIAIGYGPFSIGANYLATDTVWGNSGDIYYTATLDFDVGAGLELGLLARYFSYKNSGDYIPTTAESSNFRHFDLTLSRGIGDSPATMFAIYTFGGRDRDGLRQRDKIVLGFDYAFDIK